METTYIESSDNLSKTDNNTVIDKAINEILENKSFRLLQDMESKESSFNISKNGLEDNMLEEANLSGSNFEYSNSLDTKKYIFNISIG